jgi:hypothetical protein
MDKEIIVNEYLIRKFFQGFHRRIGVVSHVEFHGGIHHPYIDLFLKELKSLFDEISKDKLIFCSGNNRIGIDLYLQENWERIGINKPPRFSWTLDGGKKVLSKKEDKGKMFEKLVDETEGIIYFTHLDDEKNTWGYVIRKRCQKYNKKYIQILLDEEDVYSKESLNDMLISIMEVNDFLLKPSKNSNP